MLVQYNESTEQEENQSSHLQRLKTYTELYDCCDYIRNYCFKLIDYGYDPKLLMRRMEIREGEFDQIKDLRGEIVILQEDWIDRIREIYASSFVLTHFIGLNLVKFVEAITQGKQYKSLQHILL
jgi:hypothetical protein